MEFLAKTFKADGDSQRRRLQNIVGKRIHVLLVQHDSLYIPQAMAVFMGLSLDFFFIKVSFGVRTKKKCLCERRSSRNEGASTPDVLIAHFLLELGSLRVLTLSFFSGLAT